MEKRPKTCRENREKASALLLSGEKIMLRLAFKDLKKFDLIENGKVTHYFRVVFADNLVALVDNKFNTLKIYTNNNNGVQTNEYKI